MLQQINFEQDVHNWYNVSQSNYNHLITIPWYSQIKPKM